MLQPTPSSRFSKFPEPIHFLDYFKKFKFGFLLLAAKVKISIYITKEKALPDSSKDTFSMR